MRIDQDCGKPMVGKILAIRLGKHLNAFSSVKKLAIKRMHRTPSPHSVREDFHLSASDPCANIGHPIIVANLRMLVVGRVIPGLGCEEYCLLLLFGSAAGERTASGCGDDLIAIEREHAELT